MKFIKVFVFAVLVVFSLPLKSQHSRKFEIHLDSLAIKGKQSVLPRLFFVDTAIYTSIKNRKIYIQQGAINGKPISGKFKVFYYPSNQLKTVGRYRRGKKVGEWQSWNKDGKLVNRVVIKKKSKRKKQKVVKGKDETVSNED